MMVMVMVMVMVNKFYSAYGCCHRRCVRIHGCVCMFLMRVCMCVMRVCMCVICVYVCRSNQDLNGCQEELIADLAKAW